MLTQCNINFILCVLGVGFIWQLKVSFSSVFKEVMLQRSFLLENRVL